jgi:hypothetical protein
LKLSGTHQLIIYADGVNIVDRSVHTIRKNTVVLVVASKETNLEVNAEKTKYMVMFQDQNAGQNHSIHVDNSSSERVEEFSFLGTNLRNQNSIQEEIKSRMKSGNSCYTKNLKIKINYNFVCCFVWV